MQRILLVLALALLPVVAPAEVRVFACEPEWAALAEEIGGEQVDAYSATTALQDPHYLQARPSLIARVRRADLVVCSGAELEIGWLPVLLQKANNRDVLPGSPGFVEASSLVERFDATLGADRSQGDIHPLGNPHVQGNPHNLAVVAKTLAERMALLDAGNAEVYAAGLDSFLTRWEAAIAEWEKRAAPLRGKKIIGHHRSWVYLARWLGLIELDNLEAVPGIPPTVGHLSQLSTRYADGGADFIVRSPYQDARASEWLSKRTGIPAIELPLTVGGHDDATDLFSLFDVIIDTLLEAGT